MANAPQAEQGKQKKRRRRFHPFRTLIILIGLIIVTALCEPFLYYTPLYPLGEGAVGLVTFAVESVQELTDSLTSLSWRNNSTSHESDYPLTILVNRWNPVPDDIRCNLIVVEDGKSVDARCADDLKQMLADCRAEGLHPLIRSAYRSYSYQTDLFNNKVDRLRAEGKDSDAAYNEAMTVVALPGTSEHQLGLALDLVDESYQNLDEGQENTKVQKWLMQNSWRYGFILRYPTDKSSVTGIIYEPWHYRYLGRDMARDVYESGLCLEEFLER